MTRKASNFSDLIQRVTASCLLHPLAAGVKEESSLCESEENRYEEEGEEYEEEEGDGEEDKMYEEEKMVGLSGLKVKQMEEVFETVSSMKRAYVRLQEAHSPWDPISHVAHMCRLNQRH